MVWPIMQKRCSSDTHLWHNDLFVLIKPLDLKFEKRQTSSNHDHLASLVKKSAH